MKFVKHLWKTNDFGRSRAGSGCFRGPPWKPWVLPGGANGGCQEVFGGSICVLDGFLVVAGATLGPERSPLPLMTAPWGFILVHFLLHFATFLWLSPFCVCSKRRREARNSDSIRKGKLRKKTARKMDYVVHVLTESFLRLELEKHNGTQFIQQPPR